MIKNEREYYITKDWARRFAASVRAIEEGRARNLSPDPLIAKAQKDALASQLADLESELREYDAVKKIDGALAELDAEYVLPSALVEARNALGMTRQELADRIGLKAELIRSYEETGYESADASRVSEVAAALRAWRDELQSAISE